MNDSEKIYSARMQLVESGGRTAQELGVGRIVGQILVYLYLQPEPCSLDDLEKELGLSKAAVSVAARQLEQLRLIKRVWIKGQRKKYYRSADNLANALQHGLLTIARQRVEEFGEQLNVTQTLIGDIDNVDNEDARFLSKRLRRAGKLQKSLDWLLGNPLLKLLAKVMDGKAVQ